MSQHEKFNFKNSDDLLSKAQELCVDLPFQESIEPLFLPIAIGSKMVPNRFAVQPMEGFDANPDGSPSEYTFRRYQRYAEGGSGSIWFEATSVVQEGRSNPRQLMFNRRTVDDFKRLVDHTRKSAHSVFGNSHDPYLVLQITHSGRYSRPDGEALNKVGCYNPYLGKAGAGYSLFGDDELDRLIDVFVEGSGLALKAGFDAVDIKACHGYLIHELLGAHTRSDSRYGGSLENRSRLLMEVVKRVQDENPGIDVAVRLNATDGIPYPYGFGMAEDATADIDLAEPKAIIRQLVESGCVLLNITTGVPAYTPHYVRPFDRTVTGANTPDEHPLVGVSRMLHIAGELQQTFPSTPIVSSGYSWLRHLFPNVGAAMIQQKLTSLVGLGRSSFAYPDAPKDLMDTGKVNPKKTCITCSRCTELMRNDHITGCVIRDREIYGKEYKKLGLT